MLYIINYNTKHNLYILLLFNFNTTIISCQYIILSCYYYICQQYLALIPQKSTYQAKCLASAKYFHIAKQTAEDGLFCDCVFYENECSKIMKHHFASFNESRLYKIQTTT